MRHLIARLALAAITAGAAHSPAVASELDDIRRIAEQAQRIQDQARSSEMPDWLRGTAGAVDVAPERDSADRIARQAMERLAGGQPGGGAPGEDERPPATVAEKGRTVVVAISWSLGEAAIRDLLASAPPDVRYVVRGLLDGERLTDAIIRLRRAAGDQEQPPSVVIDPTVFSEHDVTVVPEVLVFENGVLAARARGLAHPGAVLARLEAGECGDFGALGPTEPIAEADLIAVMQARAAQIDLRGAKERALASYWKRAPLVELETATVERTRRIDATVVVKRDITLPDGRVVAAAGTRINPFQVMPFRYRLIVIDGRDPRQVRQAAQLAADAPPNKRVMILLSSLDRGAGWDGLRALEASLGRGVQVLTPEIRDRLKLERVPAVIEGAGSVFTVHEIPPKGDAP
ncbi:TrbC family F-type conjugative pilus assembly protein [Azospirillum sp. sgz302134]